MKISLLFIFGLLMSVQSFAKTTDKEPFKDAEANFKLVMEKLLDRYIDKNVSKEELYKAATAGMLSSLNSGEETWNKLLTPHDLEQMKIDFSGKVTGIGVEIKWDDHNGYSQILRTIPGTPAEKAGLKADDQILSVDGEKFKGKKLADMANALRGETGKTVSLKVLRDDRILTVNLKREIVPWAPVDLEKVDGTTDLLTISFFNEQTPKMVEERIQEINKSGVKRLIVDLRNNDGGVFDQAVKVAGLFLPEDSVIATTKDRAGDVKKFRSTQGILDQDVQMIVLTNKGTFCGAELLVAALKENKKVKTVGETTFGKWNAQSVETLPNNFAVKYTVEEFLSPNGNTYQGVGIKPDLEVTLPKDTDINVLKARYEISKRLGLDPQLKAALELIESA